MFCRSLAGRSQIWGPLQASRPVLSLSTTKNKKATSENPSLRIQHGLPFSPTKNKVPFWLLFQSGSTRGLGVPSHSILVMTDYKTFAACTVLI